ncbi:MAG: hypothetical protein M9899_10445 [Bdellovibrionaceae bacterium]|nr:hypothetical protein [Pseudobdellovibrionaceae bacterium]
METQKVVHGFVDALVAFASHWLIPVMMFAFISAIVVRFIIYYTVKREEWMAKEFEKRIENFLDERSTKTSLSFYVITKRLLEKTYYELFKVRFIMKRRKPDFVMTVGDRVFMIKQGAAFLVDDMLKHLKHVRYNEANHPRLGTITQKAFSKNPCFSKVFGIFSINTLNDVINTLPGIFIVLGVFGTFLGIMQALPELGAMDIADPDATKAVMDNFLIQIAFAMSTSLMGISLSVTLNLFNTSLSPEKLFVSAVERMESALDTLWHLSANNDVPDDLTEFDENRNPDEVLAEQALNEELILGKKRKKAS